MLTGEQLKEFRLLRGLSLRDVAAYTMPQISAQMIGMVENGERNITDDNYKSIVNGINRAYYARFNGTFYREPMTTTKSEVRQEPVREAPPETEAMKEDKPAVKTTTQKAKTTSLKSKPRKDK